MFVSGYVVRYCTIPGCDHTGEPDGRCSNVIGSRVYVDPAQKLLIKDKPLVISHNDKHVVGRCVQQIDAPDGILLTCVLDDAYLLESLRRRYDDFRDNYNPSIPDFETYCKKTLCSFSLSHNSATMDVRHVSLVDTPGRYGTAVEYKVDAGVVLKRRAENQFISDIVASHSTAFMPLGDRKAYLLRNDQLSFNPGNLCYINANRSLPTKRTGDTLASAPTAKMVNQQDMFNETAEFFRIYKIISANPGMLSGAPAAVAPPSLKRSLRLDEEEESAKRARISDDITEVAASASRMDTGAVPTSLSPTPAQAVGTSSSLAITNDQLLEVIKDGMKHAVTAALDAYKQQSTPPAAVQTPSATTGQSVPPVASGSGAGDDSTSYTASTADLPTDGCQVEASRGRSVNSGMTPNKQVMDMLVKHIMGLSE
ncbi:hypothetical protein RRG08_010273 [Elysia crispata]|uniref:Uncharacterized protein n=1 Tax=Elysia crispata TaxID=231223 RepID=A0AAE1D8M7_9GAST|nr:hypothetical protein RRG08_010273 [Elysia crispata]